MKKIILDTDLGSDCDDAGAIALMHRLAELGETEILAVTHCTSEIGGAITVKAINEYYGRADLPVGQYSEKPFLDNEICKRFTKHIMENYLENHKMPKIENATKLMRKVLAQNSDVTLIAIGFLNNYAELLRSQPDEISPLTGIELIKKHVKELYAMGGNFIDLTNAEYNVKMDIESAKYVSENFPLPITYIGYELGETIRTGESLKTASENNPVKKIYSLRQADRLRESWDPITLYCAIRDSNTLFKKSEKCKITFNDNGCVVINGRGKDCYLIANTTDEEVREELEKYMV
ncbi:MAG: nucleoside hydrolase [Clostridia bacterium]|nr:nucleoside hydrolase [Clostridia bacterium]